MKMTESEKINLVSCIINFEDLQVWLRPFSLNRNACKIMAASSKLAWKYQEGLHNSAGIEIQAKLS